MLGHPKISPFLLILQTILVEGRIQTILVEGLQQGSTERCLIYHGLLGQGRSLLWPLHKGAGIPRMPVLIVVISLDHSLSLSSKRHQSQFLMSAAVEDLSAGDHRRGGWGLQSLAFQVYNVADENQSPAECRLLLSRASIHSGLLVVPDLPSCVGNKTEVPPESWTRLLLLLSPPQAWSVSQASGLQSFCSLRGSFWIPFSAVTAGVPLYIRCLGTLHWGLFFAPRQDAHKPWISWNRDLRATRQPVFLYLS